MANMLRRLLPPLLLENHIGFSGAPILSISAAKRALSTSSRSDLHGEAADELSSRPRNLPTEKDGSKSKDNSSQEDEVGAYVNPETGEVSGPRGPEPTRYGDWERKGRCSDF